MTENKLTPFALSNAIYNSNSKSESIRRADRIKNHLENILKFDMSEALEYDKIMFKKTIDASEKLHLTSDSNEILKRILLMIDNTGIECTSHTNGDKMLPLPSVIAHGGSRITLSIPKDKDNISIELLNAIKGNSALYERLTSTHDVEYNNKTGEFKEKRNKVVGILNALPTRHKNYSIDLNIGGIGNLDIHGDIIGNLEEGKATGKNGHLLFVKTSIKDRDFIMIGIEGSKPKMDGTYGVHGIGVPNLLSAFGSLKLNNMNDVHQNNGQYLIPNRDSIQITLSKEECRDIIDHLKKNQYNDNILDKSSKARGMKLFGQFVKNILSNVANNKDDVNKQIDQLVERSKFTKVKFDTDDFKNSASDILDKLPKDKSLDKKQVEVIFDDLLNKFTSTSSAEIIENNKSKNNIYRNTYESNLEKEEVTKYSEEKIDNAKPILNEINQDTYTRNFKDDLKKFLLRKKEPNRLALNEQTMKSLNMISESFSKAGLKQEDNKHLTLSVPRDTSRRNTLDR